MAGKNVRSGALAAVATMAAIALALLALPGEPSASAATSPTAMSTVQYHGYQFQVPASWPVYNLATDPNQCVLFNQHAVYLGTPNAGQHCPSRAFGHTEAMLVQPSGSTNDLPPGTVVLPSDTAALPLGALPSSVSALDAIDHAVQVEAPGPRVLVTATYGSDQTEVRTILAGATMTSAAPSATPAPTSSATPAPTVTPTASPTATPSPGPATQPSEELQGTRASGLGFDSCTVPSVATMTDWLASPYRVASTYLGGVNWACSYGDFDSQWVSQVAAQGWKFIPIWVGPQAPCTSIGGATTIDPDQAAAEGQAEAASAVAAAEAFGYGAGTPIYFDMEGYDHSDTSCSQAVLTFLGGWTRGLHAAGYLSGVYSSAGSGIVDLASEYGDPGYASPDDIWIADWTGDPVLTDPYLSDADWASHQRMHQYYGSHNETWGGATVNVDSDVVDGEVAGLPGASPARPFMTDVPSAVTAAPGTTANVELIITGAAASVHWQASAPAGLTVTPSSGVTAARPGGIAAVHLAVTLDQSVPGGRYVIPIDATAGGQRLTETFAMVSAVAPGQSLAAGYPVVLYAADPASAAVAVAVARQFALPASDVTGNFTTAWNDVMAGSDLLLAVGQAATNALNDNACGWPNPAGDPAGTTGIYYAGVPWQQPLGAPFFEPSDGTNPLATAQLTGQLLQYALAGTYPDDGGRPTGPTPPADVCLGSPDVPVP